MGRPRVVAAGLTDVGLKRTRNEDSFAVLDDSNLYVVADGMGGHSSGEVASKMAIETLKEFFVATGNDPDMTWPYKMDKARGYEENRLITAIKLANLRIYETAQKNTKLRGMGTTVVSILVVDGGVLVAHVGDSRVYRVREGQMEQLTEDHSLLNDYIKLKRLTPEQIEKFPHKNVIVRALGMKDSVKVDTYFDAPKAGDIYVLCSDGLAGPASDEEILEEVRKERDIEKCASNLIAKANENGGPDNVTAVLCKVIGST